MNLVTNIRNWIQRFPRAIGINGWLLKQQRKLALKKNKGSLREFIYLDEVSVYSLHASRQGEIASQFTDTEKASLNAGVPNAFGGSVEIGSQVVRKSIIQSTFKRFHDNEIRLNSFAIRPIDNSTEFPMSQNLNDPLFISEASAAGWIVDPDKLTRGQLLEMEVEMDVEDIFHVSEILSTILEIIEDDYEVFKITQDQNFHQMKSFGRVFEKLLAGLVPIRGRAVDYEVIELKEREWIVHRRFLDQLQNSESSSTHPLYVVGVTEETLFWKDIRRVLFSKARFQVLCRIAQDHIQDSWTPIKLTHIIDSVVPGFGEQFNMVSSQALATMSSNSKINQGAEQKQRLMQKALVSYAERLAARQDHTISIQDLSEAGLLSEEQCNSFDDLTSRREAFKAITTFVSHRSSLALNPDDENESLALARLRDEVLQDVGLVDSEQPKSMIIPKDVPFVGDSENRYIDAEFVAIYW